MVLISKRKKKKKKICILDYNFIMVIDQVKERHVNFVMFFLYLFFCSVYPERMLDWSAKAIHTSQILKCRIEIKFSLRFRDGLFGPTEKWVKGKKGRRKSEWKILIFSLFSSQEKIRRKSGYMGFFHSTIKLPTQQINDHNIFIIGEVTSCR